jgi:Zn-finger domain-containing protein
MVYISERKKEEEESIIDKLRYSPFQKSEKERRIDELEQYPWRRNKEELEEIRKKYNQKPEEQKKICVDMPYHKIKNMDWILWSVGIKNDRYERDNERF